MSEDELLQQCMHVDEKQEDVSRQKKQQKLSVNYKGSAVLSVTRVTVFSCKQ